MKGTSFRLTRAKLARVAADTLLVNVALGTALVVRFMWTFTRYSDSPTTDMGAVFSEFVLAYQLNALPLSLVCLIIFSLSGFYTYGRVYQSRYKALTIVGAVVQAYVMFAFLAYFFWDALGTTHVPRAALVLAGGLNLGMMLVSRMWTVIWDRIVRPERDAVMKFQDDRCRNVLVIGGAGYIGSALLPKLLKAGHRVRVLDLFLYGTDPIREVAHHPNLELVKGDFRHVENVVQAMRDVDAVVHLGAIVGDPACDLDQDVTIDINLSATQMIAQVAKATGIRRFVFASTCSVYGACDEILDERSEVKPISLYGRTKLAAERGLQKMADPSFTPTIVRFSTIYGLSGRTRFDLVINLLSAKAKIDGQITVHGGSQWRPFVHVDDAAFAVFHILQAPLQVVANEIYNVGSDDQNYTIEAVGHMIHAQVEGSELILNREAPDKRNYRVSFAKIQKDLGFQPQWTVEKGITQVVDAVVSGHVANYREARYSNAKYLRDNGILDVIRVDDDWSTTELSSPEPVSQIAS